MPDRSDLCLLGAGWESLHPGRIPALLSQPSLSENWEAQEPEVGMRWETTREQGSWLSKFKVGRERKPHIYGHLWTQEWNIGNNISVQKINYENQLLLYLLHDKVPLFLPKIMQPQPATFVNNDLY